MAIAFDLLEQSYALVAVRSGEGALGSHGRSRAIAHRTADQTARTAALHAVCHAGMEEIAQMAWVSGDPWSLPDALPASPAAPNAMVSLTADLEMLYERFIDHTRLDNALTGREATGMVPW